MVFQHRHIVTISDTSSGIQLGEKKHVVQDMDSHEYDDDTDQNMDLEPADPLPEAMPPLPDALHSNSEGNARYSKFTWQHGSLFYHTVVAGFHC